ncbi:ABC transporter ATP-binding protein [Candidatus Giovannonibacteria bacterium]|nr:ABC transporter ATP-binding protein [Candidatus Giovannonibacteria bacterium]
MQNSNVKTFNTSEGKPVRVRNIFKIYISEMLKFPWLVTFLVVSTIGMQIADLAAPIYLKRFFNLLAANDTSQAPELFWIVGIVAIISFLGWLARRVQAYSNMNMESKVMANLYSSAFYYMLKHSYRFFISRFSGTLTRRVSKFAGAFEMMADAIIQQFLPAAFFAVGAVTVLFFRNHTLGIILGVWAVVFVIFQIYVAKLRRPLRAARAEADSRMIGSLSDAISNQNTIALFSGNEYEQGRFRETVNVWQKATLRTWNADELVWSVLGVLMVGINIGLLYGAVIFWRKGLLMVGDFVLIQSYLLGLFERLMSINREIRRFYNAFADAAEMVEILEEPHEIKNVPGALPLETSGCEIEFKNVDFYFYPGRPLLNKFNLKIKGGEKLALVGTSGAGKSTVTKLLLRLFDIAGGEILIDGENIAKVAQDSLREAIAFVPQEPILFHRTLLENIRYGKREASDEEVLEAAKKAHCHEFIAELPEGYQTYVGERGVKLSGGERQRVAIARAILKNAPILVLDEATSSLDSESEALIQDALHTLMEGKTVLVIAHRLSTIMKMDRIVVIESGKVVAEGTHRELLKQEGGLYQKLWNIQAGGFQEEDEEPEKPAVEVETEELAEHPEEK